MVAWTEYRETASARGALALELFVVESTPSGDPAAVKAALPDHLAYQREMEQQGKLVLAGPVSDPTGKEMHGAGIIVYRATSMADARALADGDPMHKSGARNYTLRKWLVNEGSLTIEVGLSSGRAILR